MSQWVYFFEHISSFQRSMFLVSGIAFFWLLEYARPLVKFSYKKWRHALVNFFFTFTTILVNFSFAFLLLLAAEMTEQYNFGLLHWIGPIPLWLYFIIGLMLLDFIGAYLAHWIQHKVSWMWGFHYVHHSDLEVDTTTANRHHPGESVIRFIFTALGLVLLGAPLWMVFAYQSLSVLFSQFNHANLSLPHWMDEAISLVFVSPNMHKIHHHYKQPFTDSNYGNIFSIWDRLLGTFSKIPISSVKYGIDTQLDDTKGASLVALLKEPFRRER
jgi:sterol desaturase/sphingolipid hydroxylase (fatty acid hydroxylase superfamily)